MKVIAVIPARYGSTRFPGKPLVKIKDKTLIEWVIAGSKTSKYLNEIIVATDDERILSVAKNAGVKAVMTSEKCATGTDRIFEATKDIDFDVVINIQGDEPQINSKYIDPLVEAFINQKNLDMATLAHPIEFKDLENKNAVKVIKNMNDEAIYFSRFAIPFSRVEASCEANDASTVTLKHIGLYGYSKSFLQKFCEAPQADIEKYESLEQLRALHLGAKIKVITVDQPIQGVDTPEDMKIVEKYL